MTDLVLFGVFPYIAITLAVFGGIYWYSIDRYSFSSQSSQFLESRMLFWGTVPWHFTIVPILLAHLLVFLFPTAWGTLLGRPLRLYLLDNCGMALGLVAVVAIHMMSVPLAYMSRSAQVVVWYRR